MLEKEAALRTWRLMQAPGGPGIIDAVPLAEHRLTYLDFEGPVSGNRGTVVAFDRGEYTIIDETGDSIVVSLRGGKLQGQASIFHLRDSESWRFEFISEPQE
jgi:hypothetical protein